MAEQFAQGDLLFIKTKRDHLYEYSALTKIRNNLALQQLETREVDGVPHVILQEGEKTGHAHTIERDAVTDSFYDRHDGSMIVVVGKDTQVVHEEHNPLPLEEGYWVVKMQREYDPNTRLTNERNRARYD